MVRPARRALRVTGITQAPPPRQGDNPWEETQFSHCQFPIIPKCPSVPVAGTIPHRWGGINYCVHPHIHTCQQLLQCSKKDGHLIHCQLKFPPLNTANCLFVFYKLSHNCVTHFSPSTKHSQLCLMERKAKLVAPQLLLGVEPSFLLQWWESAFTLRHPDAP